MGSYNVIARRIFIYNIFYFRIRSYNQPVQSGGWKYSCSRKQRFYPNGVQINTARNSHIPLNYAFDTHIYFISWPWGTYSHEGHFFPVVLHFQISLWKEITRPLRLDEIVNQLTSTKFAQIMLLVAKLAPIYLVCQGCRFYLCLELDENLLELDEKLIRIYK
jgi:hypothetical protein